MWPLAMYIVVYPAIFHSYMSIYIAAPFLFRLCLLTGQFWNIPLKIEPYVGQYGERLVDLMDRFYSLTVSYPNAPERTFHTTEIIHLILIPAGNSPHIIEKSHNFHLVLHLRAKDFKYVFAALHYLLQQCTAYFHVLSQDTALGVQFRVKGAPTINRESWTGGVLAYSGGSGRCMHMDEHMVRSTLCQYHHGHTET